MQKVTPLTDAAELDAAIAESRMRPVLVFKHSRSCGVSHEALDALHSHVERAGTGAAYKMITVQSHRTVSDHATRRLGIRHETPQVILLRDGMPVWSASHFRVTAEELDRRITA
jgi:thioredoxin 1